jgi:hypothetical protein
MEHLRVEDYRDAVTAADEGSPFNHRRNGRVDAPGPKAYHRPVTRRFLAAGRFGGNARCLAHETEHGRLKDAEFSVHALDLEYGHVRGDDGAVLHGTHLDFQAGKQLGQFPKPGEDPPGDVLGKPLNDELRPNPLVDALFLEDLHGPREVDVGELSLLDILEISNVHIDPTPMCA